MILIFEVSDECEKLIVQKNGYVFPKHEQTVQEMRKRTIVVNGDNLYIELGKYIKSERERKNKF